MAEWAFHRNGRATVIFDDDCIRDTRGNVVAWLVRNCIYSLRGQHIGWFEGGVFYDSHNRVLGFLRKHTGYMPSNPGLSGLPGMPRRAGKPGFSGILGRPGYGGWSSILFENYF